MASRMRIGLILAAVALVALSGQLGARQPRQERSLPARPDFDIRAERAPAPASARALDELNARARARINRPRADARLHPYTGAIRVLDAPGWSVARDASAEELRNLLTQSSDRLGLDAEDLESLTVARDYVSRSTGLRHVSFAQTIDELPVFGASIGIHLAADGSVVRVTSSAARGAGRDREYSVTAERAAITAAADIDPDAPFAPVRVGAGTGPGRARFARGLFRRDVTAALEWFAMDGGVRLAWHVELEPEGHPRFYDLVIDAVSGQLLLRRNRVLDADGTGRVMQSDAMQALDPRRPDQMPGGTGACPPVLNHNLRDLTSPFRDSSTVLSDTGRLSGNNVHVFRGNTSTEGALGTFDGSRWIFDHPFNTAASAETALFFALNFAHDFFYDLGFDEAAGNFQVNNLGRGGLGGDPVLAIARAPGRNNATFQPAPEGSSPIISMFLFDGLGCWSQDVDGDGTLDLDGDYDTDVVIHEFHHGVTFRLNTTFTGPEAGAIGEGGGDFFAYSVNGDTLLADFSRPGGLRGINQKTYAGWQCLLFIFCEVHSNGEIWANTLWDIRERFRADLVRGSEAAAVNEVHQIYIDALKLSPPSPTMLDMRDAMLLADTIRNPGSPQSQNFCGLWESFAARGMGVNATDTADNGFNEVQAGFSVPPGCNAPPAPQTVTLAVSTTPATEAGLTPGAFTITRSEAAGTALTVNLGVAGTAVQAVDYEGLPTTATIPAGAASVTVPVVPIDDATVEVNETVVLSVVAGSGYVVGSPSTGTVTIVSDDAAPDFTITALTVPQNSGPGFTISVTDTTRNQGSGAGSASTTSFYLSVNSLLDASDTLLGTRDVPALAPGVSDVATTPLIVSATTAAGTYRIFAKADGANQFVEGSENNNVRSAVIKIGPDLVISTLTAPANVGEGLPFTVSYTAANQGGTTSGATVTRFHLSLNFSLDPGDVSLQSHPVNQLDAGTSQPGSVPLTVPSGTPGGLYYLFAVADADAQVAESSETNNNRYVSIRVGADLRVADFDVPARAAVGSTISVTDMTSNVGIGPAGASRTAFYLSANSLLDANDFDLDAFRSVDPLNAGASSVGTTVVTLPAAASTGVWYLLAQADAAGQVAESLETNNVRFAAINLGPDLSVSAASAPGTVVAGTSITVTDTVKNSGADIAPPSTTRFYLSVNSLLDANDTLLGAERSVPALGVDATSMGSTSVAIPAGLSGRHYLIIVADGDGVVVESKETNNTRTISLTINP
jgi:subtilase family serine protease